MQTLGQISGQGFIIQVQVLHISTAEHVNLLFCELYALVSQRKWVLRAQQRASEKERQEHV